MKVSFLSGALALALLALLVYAQDVHEEAAITSPEEAEVVAKSFDGSNWSVLKESSLEDEDDDSLDKRAVHACWKDSEPRGKGKLPDKGTRACPENLEKSMGLCYPKCGDKRVGFGPLCIDNCATTAFKSSGAFFCCESDEVCADLMREAAMKVPRAMVKLLIDVATHPNDVRKITQDFRQVVAEAMNLRLPLCSRLPPPSLDFDASEVLSEQAEIENAPVAAETESEEGEEHKVEEKEIQESAEIM